MPTTDPSSHVDSDRERVRDRDFDKGDRSDRLGSKQKAVASNSKSKDLSHVPCKFYKVGGCTAGGSCPFSHTMVEPGGQKETCAWFVKGNCKFGHKCALAHILPGQDMSMDRKNKKAAQAAAQAASGGVSGGGGGGGDKRDRDGKSRSKREPAGSSGPGSASGRNSLLTGSSTAPTRILHTGTSGSSASGRPPMNMPLKASISPSAPAPPLKDTDFASFASLDEMEGVQLASAPAQGKNASQEGLSDPNQAGEGPNVSFPIKSSASAVPLPPSAPRSSANTITRDFGPIGSPPSQRSQQSPNRLNGNGTFSPGTSPRVPPHLNGVNISSSPNANSGGLSSSPFSAPGTQTSFRPSSYSAALGLSAGVAASLGSGLAMMGGRKGWGDAAESGNASVGSGGYSGLLSAQLSSSVSQQRGSGFNGGGARPEYDVSFEYDEYLGAKNVRRVVRNNNETAVEDEDLEDFIPGSLTDLLTPEERSRRMSRSNSGQPAVAGLTAAAAAALDANSGLESSGGASSGAGAGVGHRHSRSVPAPSLLGDIKSIWADTTVNPLPASPNNNATHRGTPSASLTSRFEGLGVGGGLDDAGLSMSLGSASSLGMLSPSNASAAFLPGFHQQYLTAKAKQAQQAQLGQGGIGRGLRGTSGPLFVSNTAGGANSSVANNYLQPFGGSGLPSSASNSSGLHTHIHGNTQHTYRTTPSPFDLTQTLHQQQHNTFSARPIPSANNVDHNHLSKDPVLGPHVLSPSSRALQSHAPGQSLPQGLAAGYSRIHALPPLTNLTSPGNHGTFVPGTSPGMSQGMSTSGPYGDWQGASSPSHHATVGGTGTTPSGLDSMLSKLSYSAAMPRGPSLPPSAPPGITRNISGGRYPPQVQGAALSPLGGSAVSKDDDDELFSMDG